MSTCKENVGLPLLLFCQSQTLYHHYSLPLLLAHSPTSSDMPPSSATGSRRTILFLFLSVLFNCVLQAHSWDGSILLLTQHHSLFSSPPASCPAPKPNLYYQPVIGIVSHPGDGASGRLSNATNASNIPASYVKLVEAGGARVIPLIYNEPPEKLLKKLDLINGVIFTGGWAKKGLYLETVRKIFKKVLQKNDAGDHFPLYGICLGFELLTMIVSEDNNIVEEFRASDQASTLQFVENVKIEGSIFQSFPPALLKKLSKDCIVMQNHHFGISPGRLQDNQKLSSFFEILTTSTDEDDKVYVSTVRSRNYPVTGFQWHPEKNAFEWGSAKIPHTGDAIRVTQSAANFLVSEARKSTNRPVSQEVRDNLIYNYKSTYGGKAGKGYDEVYIFE